MRHLALVLVLAIPTVAAAQPARDADSLFAQGRALMKDGRYAEACELFDASQRIAYSVATLVNQANCREKAEQLATAWSLFVEAAEQTRAATDAPTRKLHALATARAAKLEARLSTLTIEVADDARVVGLAITQGKNPVPESEWGKPKPIDGGHYTLVVHTPSLPDRTFEVDVAAAADRKAIRIAAPPAPAPLAKPLAIAPAPSTPAAAPMPVVDAPRAHRSSRAPIVMGFTAAAFVGVAIAFELSSRKTAALAKGTDDARQREALEGRASTRHYVAQGLAVAGVASAGVALWLRLRSVNDDARPAPRIGRFDVDPIVGPQQAGLQLSTSY